jgi:multiple sugar transport system permease protein
MMKGENNNDKKPDAPHTLKGSAGRVSGQSWMRRGVTHLILMAAAAMFLMPLIFMLSTSLKPPRQTMTRPQTWIPTATLTELNGVETLVEKEKQLEEDSLIVVAREGELKGVRQVLSTRDVVDGKAYLKIVRAGREILSPLPIEIEIVKACPKGWWLVKEWLPDFSAAREKSKSERAWDCVPESALRVKAHAFIENYPSALARMQETGSESTWYNTGVVCYLLNTLWICGLSVLGAVVSCTLVAYAFAFLEFRGRNWLFALTLATMMVPFPATMVPSFDLYRTLGWVGTFKPLWVPLWFGGAFYIFLLRQFFLGLPKDLLDAARIDGCTELEILWHVVVPLAKPALAMVALFQFLGSWKDFMGPLLYLTDRSQFTLSLGLQAFQSQQGGTPWHLSMAASMMFSLPLLILFLIARKSFMKGIAMTGLKG